MADIRIKDLTTEAPASVTSDFLPIDGSTGTRKLSAFNPTFGGNATVGGTLTVNGASASIVGTAFFGASSDVQASRAAAGVLDVRHPSNTTSRIDVTGATSAGIGYRQSGARDWFVSAESNELRTSCLTANSVASYESGVLVRVRDTTDSTTKSDGAFVISGGVGVEKNIIAGSGIAARGTLTLPAAWTGSYGIGLEHNNATATSRIFFGDGTGYTLKFASRSSSTTTDRMTLTDTGNLTVGGMIKGAAATYSGSPPAGVTSAFQVDVENATTRDVLSFGDASRAGLLRGYHDGSGGIRWSFGRYAGGAYDEYARLEGTTAANGKLYIYGTTASTTTSSGALVVSGGVGVAKEMYLGGGLLNVAKGGAGATIEINADSGFASKLAMQRAATNRWTLEVDSSDVLTLKSLGTTAALTMTGTTSAEFVGSIKTSAPSGGTAANWKLGTVATVSPTSPNRTIEVDIGGTIYYIHAKTTNN
jgi:hypothetical protein